MRLALIALCFFACGAAHADDASRTAKTIDKSLARAVKGEGDAVPIAGAALAVMIGDRLVYSGAAGCAEFDATKSGKCVRPLKPTSKMRVASISKMALAMGLMSLIEDGKLDLDADVSTYLGSRLRNPSFPDEPITARRLLSHTSSIRDPEEYWVAAPGRFQNMIEANAAIFAAPPQTAGWFKYANLNYGILAGAIEGAAHQRFDLFMTERLFTPAALDIGFNWSGVSLEARSAGAALPRREDGRWVAVVDGPSVLSDQIPYFLAAEGLDRRTYLERYAPGENPTLFSPQGGLRASVEDLARLVLKLKNLDELTSLVWRYEEASPNGDTEDGLYGAFGLGVQIVDGNDALLPDSTLIGHAGDAYGLYSGAWLLKADPERRRKHDVAIAYVSTGVDAPPARSAHPAFNVIEARLLRLALKAAESFNESSQTEPRPFDEQADAMQMIDAAILSAQATRKMPLLILGGNWCHDSRGLAAKFDMEPLKSLISENYQTVWVDVGARDRNLEVAERFGVGALIGTPTVIILSPDGMIRNPESVHDWRTADSKTLDEAIRYFGSFIQQPDEAAGGARDAVD